MPQSVSFNDAGTWRTAVNVYYNDAGTWRTLSEVHYNDAGTWRQVFTAATLTAPSGTVDHTVGFPTDASSGFSMVSDGDCTTNAGNTPSDLTNWYTPTTGGIGSSYWVRATLTAGTTPTSGTMDTWLALSSNRSWANVITGSGSLTSTMTMDISSDSSGSPIVATGSITVTAESA